jgi:hypothetical protein
MKKYYLLAVFCMAACMLLWFAGCSNDQPKTVSGPTTIEGDNSGSAIQLNARDAVVTETENNGMRSDAGCCISPVVIYQSVTDSSITIQICARSTGAVGGVLLQWVSIAPDGINCPGFVFPTTGVSQVLIPIPLAPFQCLTVTVNGLNCETEYIFRTFAVNGQGCASAPSNKICAITAPCPELLCVDMPGVLTCTGTPTSSTIELEVCAGNSGAPAGLELEFMQLSSPTMVCSSFVFDSLNAVFQTYTAPGYLLGSNECANITVENLICETPYVFRVRALQATGFDCPSVWTKNGCCNTAACEGGPGPCVSLPTISCASHDGTVLTLNVCAGATGTRTGIWVQYFPLDAGAACSDTMHFPATDFLQVRPGPFLPDECKAVTLTNLIPGRAYAIRAQAMFCQPFECPSTFTAVLCCSTGTETGPVSLCVENLAFWQTHVGSWPVTHLMIGGTDYSSVQLQTALARSTTNNALATLGKQIIAAKLNQAAGANVSAITADLAQANTLLTGLSLTMGVVGPTTTLGQQMLALASHLQQYNGGSLGIPLCF